MIMNKVKLLYRDNIDPTEDRDNAVSNTRSILPSFALALSMRASLVTVFVIEPS